MGTPRLGDAQRLGNSGNVRTDKIQSAIIFVDPATSLDILFGVHVDDIVPIPTSHCTSQSGFGRRCVYYVRSALGKGDLLMFYVAPVTSEFYHKTHLLGSLEAQRRARPSSNAMAVKKARAREKKSGRRDANAANTANAGEAFTRLPNHLVVTHVLRPEYFDYPADLARLPAVSRAMRDLVAETGLRFEELDEDEAVELGCVSAVQRMQRQGRLSRKEYLCLAAASVGNLVKLKEFRENGCPWDKWTCAYAAKNGYLEVLQWARANGCPWDSNTCSGAARDGLLEVLQWARANGCPWNVDTCYQAVGSGHLKVLLWARANGCPRDKNELHIVALNGQVAMVRALIESGADVNKAGDGDATPLYAAAQKGHEVVARALMELGADVNKATDNGVTPLYAAAQNGHKTVVRALIEAGADINKPWDNGATPLHAAAQEGHEAVVRALIELGVDVNKARDDGVTPLSIAVQQGHTAIVQILKGCLIGPDAEFVFVNTRRTILYTLTSTLKLRRRSPAPRARVLFRPLFRRQPLNHGFTFLLVTADPPLFINWHARRGRREYSNEPMYVSIGVLTAMYLLRTWCSRNG